MNVNIKDYDGLTFYREDSETVNITGFKLEDPGIKKNGSPMGELYDIIIFNDVLQNPSMPERFEAILSSPIDYVKRMINDGFLGVVVKSSSTSDKFMNEAFETAEEYIQDWMKHHEGKHND